MGTLDIMALIELTALFAMFAVAMAGAEVLLRRNAAARVPAQISHKPKRRPF